MAQLTEQTAAPGEAKRGREEEGGRVDEQGHGSNEHTAHASVTTPGNSVLLLFPSTPNHATEIADSQVPPLIYGCCVHAPAGHLPDHHSAAPPLVLPLPLPLELAVALEGRHQTRRLQPLTRAAMA